MYLSRDEMYLVFTEKKTTKKKKNKFSFYFIQYGHFRGENAKTKNI